jgi:hypothetical protein
LSLRDLGESPTKNKKNPTKGFTIEKNLFKLRRILLRPVFKGAERRTLIDYGIHRDGL